MQLEKQSAVYLPQYSFTDVECHASHVADGFRHAAIAAGICYGKDNRNLEGADLARYCMGLVNRGHFSPFAHVPVYIMPTNDSYAVNGQYIKKSPWLIEHVNPDNKSETVIETNLRTVLESPNVFLFKAWKECGMSFEDISQRAPWAECEPMLSVVCTTNLLIAKDFNRHAANMAICEQSTRYCNLVKKGGVVFVDGASRSASISLADAFVIDDAYERAAADYMRLVNDGVKPEIARNILPANTATRVMYTAKRSEWEHIFDLRLYGKTGRPHPDAVELAQLIHDAFAGAGYII